MRTRQRYAAAALCNTHGGYDPLHVTREAWLLAAHGAPGFHARISIIIWSGQEEHIWRSGDKRALNVVSEKVTLIAGMAIDDLRKALEIALALYLFFIVAPPGYLRYYTP
jgi:hypothetical protein